MSKVIVSKAVEEAFEQLTNGVPNEVAVQLWISSHDEFAGKCEPLKDISFETLIALVTGNYAIPFEPIFCKIKVGFEGIRYVLQTSNSQVQLVYVNEGTIYSNHYDVETFHERVADGSWIIIE